MRCNSGTDLVCTYWEKCDKARFCPNVPKGIRRKLNKSGNVRKKSSNEMFTGTTE